LKATLARIERLNNGRQREEDAVFGLNKFSDLSPEEFKNLYLMSNGIPANQEAKQNVLTPSIELGALPEYIDWEEKGAVTPVKNQEQCGSCWAFSTAEAIESANILTGKFNADNIDLAPQQIVDCDTTDDGCGGGNPPTAYQYVIGAGGLESNSSYPYTAENGNCKFRKAEVVATISSWAYATNEFKGEGLLQQNLVSWGPLSICVDAQKWQDYSSGVMAWYQCDIIPILDHCVQLVGWNATAPTPYYRVRNSWGVDWGLEGYILLETGHDTCGVTHEATWPTV
jgi:C1A family cysteine protease